VARYTEPAGTVQSVSDHPAQIVAFQKEITDLKARLFLPPACDHTEMEGGIQSLVDDPAEAWWRPAIEGSSEEFEVDMPKITSVARELGEEVRNVRRQLTNALTLVARAASAAPLRHENNGQKLPDYPDFSGLDQTQSRGWIA